MPVLDGNSMTVVKASVEGQPGGGVLHRSYYSATMSYTITVRGLRA